MFRLYLRAALSIALAVLLTVTAGRVLLDSSITDGGLRLLGGHVELLAKQLSEAPPVERRPLARRLSQTIGYPLELELRRPARPGDALQAGSEWRAGALFVVAGVPNTPGQVVLGPVPYGRVADLPAVLGLGLILSFAVAWFGVRPLLGRIRTLEEASRQMCAGDFTVRVETEPGEALDRIGLSLNQLSTRIGELLSDERDLLRTVAHEVRAPIARMRFRVENIKNRSDAGTHRDASGLVSDLQQVDSLFEELLTYVAFDEFDYERPELQTATIELGPTVRRVVEQVTSTNAEITVDVVGNGSARVVANQKLFERAVTNLLLNAMAYGGPKITVELREFAEECVVDVQDSGPGIPECDRPKVIKPFVRLAKKKTRGTGLGLAIVTRIMKLHEGRLHIMNAPRGGASMQLVWKNAEPAPRKRWFYWGEGHRSRIKPAAGASPRGMSAGSSPPAGS